MEEVTFNVGDKVKWLGAKPGTWAGDGIGQIVAGDEQRRGFGGPNGAPGLAVCVKLDGPKGLTVWCGLDEIEPVAS